jgi:hypothetical protein
MSYLKSLAFAVLLSFPLYNTCFSQVFTLEKLISNAANTEIYINDSYTTKNGDTYILGQSSNRYTTRDTILTSKDSDGLFLAKFNSEGKFLWVKRGNHAEGAAISFDKDNNCYMTGYFLGTATFDNYQLTANGGMDFFIAKYDSTGKLIWIKSNGQVTGGCGVDIYTDQNGTCYLTGSFAGTVKIGNIQLTSKGYTDIFIAKYDSNGNFGWIKQLGDTGYNTGYSISIDTDNNIFLFGNFDNTINIGNINLTQTNMYSYFVAKFDKYGTPLWVKPIDADKSVTFNISTDQDNGLLICGNYYEAGTVKVGDFEIKGNEPSNGFLIKYDSDGNLLWEKHDAFFADISIDNLNNIYAAGTFDGTLQLGSYTLKSIGQSDVFIAKYDSYGNVLWAQQKGDSNDEVCYGISMDNKENCYVLRYSHADCTYLDIFSEGKISLLSPISNQYWQVGTKQDIAWTTNVDKVMLQLSTNEGATWIDLTSSPIDGSLGSYSIAVPNKSSASCMVRVYSPEFSLVSDTSGIFTITNNALPNLTVTSPNASEKWKSGSKRNITWTSTSINDSVTIEYSKDGGISWILISDTVKAALRTYNWTVPNVTSGICKIRVKDNHDNSVYDLSDGFFTIMPNPRIIFPNNVTDTLRIGSIKNVTWSAPLIKTLSIYFSTDNGKEWKNMLSYEKDGNIIIDGSLNKYSWLVPSITESNLCKLKIADYYDQTFFDESDTVFTIYNPIKITYPKHGDTLQTGNIHDIAWTSDGVDKITIRYFQYGQADCDPLQYPYCDTVLFKTDYIRSLPYDAKSELYTWIVPDIPHERTIIRITDALNSNLYAESEKFVIAPIPSPDSLHAEFLNNSVTLTWKDMTDYEEGFKIERKEGNKNYSEIAVVSSNVTSYIDNKINSNQVNQYWYRVKAYNQIASSKYIETNISLTSAKNGKELPKTFALEQNYPNPFNPSTAISFSIPKESNVKLFIYNTLGEVISELFSGLKSAGFHEVNFNASNISSGMYFYMIEANSTDGKDNFKQVKKMLLVK